MIGGQIPDILPYPVPCVVAAVVLHSYLRLSNLLNKTMPAPLRLGQPASLYHQLFNIPDWQNNPA